MHSKLISISLYIAAISISNMASASEEFTPPNDATYRIDKLMRVVPDGLEGLTSCPDQTDRTAVLLIAGQSNTANSAEASFRTSHPERAVSYFDGKCYSAKSPLFGTNNIKGESWTLLADALIDAGNYDQVVLVTTGIGGTSISRWQAGGELNDLLLTRIDDAAAKYKITHVLWHQGESDLKLGTTSEDYRARFLSLADSIRSKGISAPIFVSTASKCGAGDFDSWAQEDAVTAAQRSLPDPQLGIFAGPDTNALISSEDRHDTCHFAKSGQHKFANEWLKVIHEHDRSTG